MYDIDSTPAFTCCIIGCILSCFPNSFFYFSFLKQGFSNYFFYVKSLVITISAGIVDFTEVIRIKNIISSLIKASLGGNTEEEVKGQRRRQHGNVKYVQGSPCERVAGRINNKGFRWKKGGRRGKERGRKREREEARGFFGAHVYMRVYFFHGLVLIHRSHYLTLSLAYSAS